MGHTPQSLPQLHNPLPHKSTRHPPLLLPKTARNPPPHKTLPHTAKSNNFPTPMYMYIHFFSGELKSFFSPDTLVILISPPREHAA
ncbi:hypothetical protein SAICODRAFT_65884 [Saitoella complicata NRRL Y-17804]|uniref:uncharacterized protein n=1 Tax=Saitoella complicata (strain BCRC 22490 / CBS 7301 / JCM 7358 / NBRC 10748 / NRRL Y-17804) TaxID=698492 RepID=UPI000867C44F|nr:uncharacterized protein SAICODRAFT_65884 [Saitoella complicata NRRL Y-17804]ODQ53067.1 hypothetical protein SAICODRAFT_65884 [Saitoella complicata NRRL Y-17804]